MPVNFQAKIILKIAIILIMAFFTYPASAYVASSTNYRMETDSINVGGTDVSTSTNYQLRDTIGGFATGNGTSTNFNLYAGYRQVDGNSISISIPGNVILSPALGGVTGGSAEGSGVWTVITDSPAGYSLFIEASTSPAMISGINHINDYAPASGGVPDYDWNIGSAVSEFGYSPFNSLNQASKFKNNTSACNTGSTVTSKKCWLGLTTSNEAVTVSSVGTTGDDTTINFKGEIRANGVQVAGAYVADITVTAISN